MAKETSQGNPMLALIGIGTWLERAAQRMHKNKLAAALANKLARIAWSVLRHERPFDSHHHRLATI